MTHTQPQPEQTVAEILADFGYKAIKLAKDDSCFYDEQMEAKAALNRQALATALRLIGDDDRDYSKDNADEQSLAILVACSTACNEYKAELRQAFTDYYGGV